MSKRILAVKWRQLGDTILWTAALQALKEWDPAASLNLALPTPYLPLFANDDRFDRHEARGTPLLAAVDDLCLRLNKSLDDMERLTMGEVFELVQSVHGQNLPDFWRIWADWNLPNQEQPTGQL